ncbi:glycosyltransferase family 39 protein [Ruegeria sp. 2012CJ41-6]|uniref:Glycosyltransferase family 39 protein n=1 Tax=Ruegeria spongiae TaxID=2942209 RepID=A0ABT0Q2N9_9RHOB|nr:glycosyltransferase family 39 protein [Ruegeria spongiae]MCL6284139.1 glycosyltransferase family 39 protein [Ruegeria spongiae]
MSYNYYNTHFEEIYTANMTPSRSAIAILTFCMGAAAIYSIGVFSRSIWFDEAYSLQSLTNIRFGEPIFGFTEMSFFNKHFDGVTTTQDVVWWYVVTDVHPPLYYLMAHAGTLIFGTQLEVVRAVSLILVVMSVFLYGRTLQRIAEPGLWICLAIYALSFAVLTTAQDARGYALIVLLVVGAWRTMAQAPILAERGTPLRFEILLGLLCGCLMLTHYFALFAIVPLLGWRVIESMRYRNAAGLVGPIVCAAVFAPWLPVMLDHLGARPDQMTGFPGIAAWAKRTLQLIPAQVFSATHWAVPASVQKVGRSVILLLMLVAAFDILFRSGQERTRQRIGWLALWIPAAGVFLFLAASLVLDRWFDTLRYFIFFAPFLAYLSGRGTMVVGNALARMTKGPVILHLLPGVLVCVALFSMANFGWETNRNRGGGYYNSIANQIRANGEQNSLAIIDVGYGRGTLFASVYALPTATTAFLLDPDTRTWPAAATSIRSDIIDRSMVVLVYTIERGAMGSDKAQLYSPIVSVLEDAGFKRVQAPPAPQGGRFYAKWVRMDGTG